MPPLAIADIHIAREKSRSGDLDGAVELSSSVVDDQFGSGGPIWSALTTTVLVEALLQRGSDGDLAGTPTRPSTDCAAMATDPGFVLNKIILLLRLRALLAHASGDDANYRECRDRYRKMANDLGFEGHMALAEAMP